MIFRLCMNNYYNKGIHYDPKVSINCLAPGTFGLPLCAGRSAAAKMVDRQGPEEDSSPGYFPLPYWTPILYWIYIPFWTYLQNSLFVPAEWRLSRGCWKPGVARFLTLCQLLKPVTKGVPSEAMKNLCMFQYVGMEWTVEVVQEMGWPR